MRESYAHVAARRPRRRTAGVAQSLQERTLPRAGGTWNLPAGEKLMSDHFDTTVMAKHDNKNFRAIIACLFSIVLGLIYWAASGFATNDRVDGIERQVQNMRDDQREMRRELNTKLDALLLKSSD